MIAAMNKIDSNPPHTHIPCKCIFHIHISFHKQWSANFREDNGALKFTCAISLHLFSIETKRLQLESAAHGSAAWLPLKFEVDNALLPYWSGYTEPSNVNGSFTAINEHKLHQHVCPLLYIFKSHLYGNIEEMAIGST